MPKRKTTEQDQQHIDGTEPPTQITNRKIETRGKKYADNLAQRMAWQKSENDARIKLEEAMLDSGVAEYWLKNGTKITCNPGKSSIKVTFPKNEDGKVDEVELREAEVG